MAMKGIDTIYFELLEISIPFIHSSDELQDTPDHWTGVECGRPEADDRNWYYNCLKDFEIGLFSLHKSNSNFKLFYSQLMRIPFSSCHWLMNLQELYKTEAMVSLKL